MKILIATGLYPPEIGGPATYTKLLETELPKHKILVEVLPFRLVRHLPSGLSHIAYFFLCLMRSHGAASIYAQDTVSVGLPAALAAWILRKKFIVRVPGDFAWEQSRQRFGVVDDLEPFQDKTYGWRTELLRSIQRFVVRRARVIVVPSVYMKNIVSRWTPSQNIRVIYSSIEVPEPKPIARPPGFLVVSAGRRVPWKGFESLEKVVAREPAWSLYIASGLPRGEALGWVAAANVFVLNSTYEGLSHQLIEAMALGTPIIATNVGGNPELIQDKVSGLLIPPNDDEALWKALTQVAKDTDAAQMRAERARETAKEFSISKTIEQVVALLTTV